MAVEHARKVRVDDTLEMGYYIDDCTDPWKEAETIILQTGCKKPRQLFYAWIPTLARRFRVIRPHLRGHWDSTPAPEGYEWTVDGLVSDLKNFLDALGLEKVHFVGESLGGFLGYHLTYRHPERLKTLTTVTSPGPSFKHHPVARKAWSIWARQAAPGEIVTGLNNQVVGDRIDEFGPEGRELAEWVNDECEKSPRAATRGYLWAAANCEVDVDAFLREIKVPTLLMMGAEHNRIVTTEEMRHFRDLIPVAKMVTFPGVKAQCQYVIPEKCAEEVVGFIREQAAG